MKVPAVEASDAVFTALAGPTRRQVLRLVAERIAETGARWDAA